MRIKIEGKTKPATPRRAVKFNQGQWANCSEEFYNNAMVGSEYETEVTENAQGFKMIVDGPGKVNSTPKPATNGNGNSEVMTKEDWKAKERYVAKQAVMKSCLESPALSEVVKMGDTNLVAEASLLFKEMWKLFNETN